MAANALPAGASVEGRRSFVVESASDFRVATDAYRRREVFEAELARIFRATWIYLGHESEIANPGDWKSTWIGLEPVIAVRGEDGAIRAFLNFCRHRGAGLVREEYGNARAFACPYHGWTYSTAGALTSMVDRERFPPDFPMEEYGLVPVPRVESYGGLVFGSFNRAIVPLVEHLAEVREHIDLWLGRCAGGRYRVGTAHRYAYDGNWKFQAENVYDGFHAHFVHGSAYNTFRKFDNAFTGRDRAAIRRIGATRGYAGGHGVLEAGSPLDNRFIDETIREAYVKRLVDLNGEATASRIRENRHLLIFPSVVVMDNNIRVIQPRAHDRTEVYSYPMIIEGVHEEINSQRLHDVQTRVGVAGIVGADDLEIFHGAQNAQRARDAAWITLSRGLHLEEKTAAGERVGAFTDETPQRAFWRRWDAMMSAGAEA